MFWKTLAILVAILGIATMFYMIVAVKPAPGMSQCTDEAKMCPDGTLVGRTGPNCEFAACPTPVTIPPVTTTSVTPLATTSITLGIGETGVVDGVSLTPRLVVSDSRCPSAPNVQCVWAGTVQINMHIADARAFETKDVSIELNKSVNTQLHHIVFSAVEPAKKPDTVIATSTYRFTLEVSEQHWGLD